MKIKRDAAKSSTLQEITLPDEEPSTSQLRPFATIILTVFIAILLVIDQLSGSWSLGNYWILFFLGLVACCILIWVLLRWNEKQRKKGKETFLEKWGDEIGWPLMILAFTIQFIIPLVRPIVLGAILGGSWFLLIRNR